jgi:hypothetical protein
MTLSVELPERILTLESGELAVAKWEPVSAAPKTAYLGKLSSLAARDEEDSVKALLARLGSRPKRTLKTF